MKVLLIVCATILGALATQPLPGHKEQNVASPVKGQVRAPALVEFCINANLEGDCITMTVGDGCFPVPVGYDNDISSVNTHGGCVVVFDVYKSSTEECITPSLVLSDTQGTGYIPDLEDYKFNDKISGVANC